MLYIHGLLGVIIAAIAFMSFFTTALLRKTSLRTAWLWAVFAAGVWVMHLIVSQTGSAAQRDLSFWLAAVISQCPWIATLGARLQREAAWTGFVILPLILVLSWPALALFVESDPDDSLVLQVPALIGFFAVVVMGTGNYFGTRFALPATLFAIGSCVCAVSISEWNFAWPLREIAVGCFIVSAILVARSVYFLKNQMSKRGLHGYFAAWSAFRDLYGIVWAKRVADRFNEVVSREDIAERLDATGFLNVQSDAGVNSISDRSQHTFRWLLKRFVQEEWIDGFCEDAPKNADYADESLKEVTTSTE